MKDKKAYSMRAKPFNVTRSQHLKETAEDYTELIADLITQKGEAKTCDIARCMNISHVTALRSIKRLQRDGYVETAPHKPVMLTRKGKRLASFSKKKHVIVLEFLIKLGVPQDVATIDTEGIEHHISPETLRIFENYLSSQKERGFHEIYQPHKAP